MKNWSERIESLDRGVGVNIRPISQDYIATVTTLCPATIHKNLWQDIYPTFEEAKCAAYAHANKPYAELENTSFKNKS